MVGRTMPIPMTERPPFLILLAQGGEFGFVVLQTAAGAGVIDAPTRHRRWGMPWPSRCRSRRWCCCCPNCWWAAHLVARAQGPQLDEISEPQHAPVIIAGFGRYGQIVGRLLYANGFAATVLEHDAEQVEAVRRFGWPVFYGDATRLDLLRTAGADKARVMVLAIDDVEQSVEVAKLVREHFPRLTIVARARNVTHYYELRKLNNQEAIFITSPINCQANKSIIGIKFLLKAISTTYSFNKKITNEATITIGRCWGL